MIFEQAFQYLPEILSGRSYPSQDHEGGIVAAFSMAVLQELNARNTANPLSLIQCETLFRQKIPAWPSLKKGQAKRYLRADLCVNLHEMRQGNPSLEAYGWRHSNWLEAKFFRAFHAQTGLPKANSNQSLHTGCLLADVYRLLALCPRGLPRKVEEDPNKQNRSNVGRYLLHVYSGSVDQHLSLRIQGGAERAWIKTITEPGSNSIENFRLIDEPPTVRKHVGGDLTNLRLDFSSTNFVIAPTQEKPPGITFTCVLTRINSFKLTHGDDFWGLESDRSIICSEDDDAQIHKKISEFVAARIQLKLDIETKKPPLSDLETADGVEDDSKD